MSKYGITKNFITKVGYPAFIIERWGWIRGYVTTPLGHLWYGKTHLTKVPVLFPKIKDRDPFIKELIDIHGGITYSGDNPDTGWGWCFGFECNYYEDPPGYWTISRAKIEAEKLAKQLKKYQARTSKG